MSLSSRYFAQNGGSIHFPAIAVVIIECLMDADAIVPERESLRLPSQAAAEGGLDDMLFQKIE